MNTPISLAFLALVCFGLISFCLKIGGDQQAYGPSYMLAHSVGFLLVAPSAKTQVGIVSQNRWFSGSGRYTRRNRYSSNHNRV